MRMTEVELSKNTSYVNMLSTK